MDFELTEEQKEIKRAVREFTEKEFKPEIAREYDLKEEFPWEIYRKCAKLGFIAPHFEEEYGGQGLSFFDYLLIIEELCRADSTLGTAMITGPFGGELIHMFGSEEQKKKYLPPITRGEWVSSAAFTEPNHGSDITFLETTAKPEGDHYIINGTKTLITNAPIASFIVVLCQVKPEAGVKGQSLFVVDRDVEGLDITKIEHKMGIKASPIGEISFNSVRVPKNALVGCEFMGFYHSMEFFDVTRVGVAAQALGMAQGAYEKALKYAKERMQFGRRLSDFQVIQHKLVDMATALESARLLVYKAAWYIDKGRIIPELSCMAKNLATSTAVKVVNDALQIFGGYGYISDYDIERYYRDVRITEIYEGTTEIQKNIAARFLLGK
ncbi:MAG: acyl-CoA dehydrogenase [Candidatus Hecatellales archaeon]|nr:MAG: acyl-CoA dehydrogenase [Candidatus Hecatellales archaeon]